jgi:hypothetical protein
MKNFSGGYMDKFNVKCSDHFPMKCNLSIADKDYLLTPEKYKAFFIYQYKEQDEWLQPTLERYFNERTWRLYNAGLEGGLGTKFCNVCRYALAADFGIASLTPFNYNVFQEIGLMQGLQKPVLYVLNPKKKEKLPFDIDDQIYVEHTDTKTLERGLNNKISLIIDKVQLLSGFEKDQKDMVKKKVDRLSLEAKKLLKRLLLEGPFSLKADSFDDFVNSQFKAAYGLIRQLKEKRFIIDEPVIQGSNTIWIRKFNNHYGKYLEDILWE